jgi:alpha-L-rhamnosidase
VAGDSRDGAGGEPQPLDGGRATAGEAAAANLGDTPGAAAGQASDDDDQPPAPSGLLCELMPHPERVGLVDREPEFSFLLTSPHASETQLAYQILVATSEAQLGIDEGSAWDSGKVLSPASVDIPYAGLELEASTTYFWKVRWWDSRDRASDWSEPQSFQLDVDTAYATPREPVEQESREPARVTTLGNGRIFAEFSRAAFGWLELDIDAPAATTLDIELGESALGQSVNPEPGGRIRYVHTSLEVTPGRRRYRVETPKDAQNTGDAAFALPEALGVVLPFRYVGISGAEGLTTLELRQIALHYPFDARAATFSSSNPQLDSVYELSKYSIIATTFAAVYLDGDRERIPYEGDAYIQQLGHYSLDRDYALARFSLEYLLDHPTEYTEWQQHTVALAWNDWMYTGNTEALTHAYSKLQTQHTFEDRLTASGLIDTSGLEDLVDWPAAERDGYELLPINTVVNAFFYRTMQQMADIAAALGKVDDATRYRRLADDARAGLQREVFDSTTGLYVDGVGSTHSSLHANMLPLAMGLVPDDALHRVVEFVKSRGMACSVYGAQYLLEGLYRAGAADAALALLTSPSERSWLHMLDVGASITTEAWDLKYKPNSDWNHAWGAAPANILPRYLLGVRPLSPGFARAEVRPQPASLTHVEGVVPTIRGPVEVAWKAGPEPELSVTLPVNMTAELALPDALGDACQVLMDGEPAATTTLEGVRWLQALGSGRHRLSCGP